MIAQSNSLAQPQKHQSLGDSDRSVGTWKGTRSMRHYIIAKWKEGVDRQAMLPLVKELFDRTIEIPGIHEVRVSPCCIDRPNRYDIMIEIGMDPEALAAYDACAPHREWKERYGSLLSAKTIFDRDDDS